MAVDTLTKRSAALRFGMGHLAGTRPPSGSLDAFERAALLGSYYIVAAPVTVGTPTCGWTFETFETFETVWTLEASETVWILGDC